ncbi:MAG: degV family protein [Peptococcaceae bacterium BICA1-7]|nr:MAG: degV family protein [Peptococcaceae bacterium BICA1-7]HBV98156.1 DegV family protein [Desulfotomaculum sp.]
MGKLRIVTDSTADLPDDIVQRYNITVVPLKVFFGEEVYLDRVEITSEEFFRRQTNGETSSTSQPSPAEFVEYYTPLVKGGDEIISIHISSLMSGTVQSANLARTMLNYPGLEVIDSGMAGVPLGILVLNAARAAEEGKSGEEIKGLISRWLSELEVYFMVDSLEYLQRGGRIGKAQAFLGTLLNVKPLLTINGGLVSPYEKVRGKSKALARIISILGDKFGYGARLQCLVTHGDFPEGAEELKKGLRENFNCAEIIDTRLGTVVGTHVGPSLAGCVCLPVKD